MSLQSRELKMPELGENIQKAAILSVLVSPGDRVEKDQPLLEIETDKATVEVPAEAEGVVEEVLVQAGDSAQVGQVVLRLKPTGAATPPGPQAAASLAPPAQVPQAAGGAAPPRPENAAAPGPRVHEVLLPELGEGVEAADLLAVLVAVGDMVERDQPVLEIGTDKATVEVPSDAPGEVLEILARAGQKVKVGEPILRLRAAGAPTGQATPAPPPPPPAATPRTEGAATPPPQAAPAPSAAPTGGAPPWAPREAPAPARKIVPAAPSVRRVARELGVDITEVQGRGPRGRISSEDVKAHVREALTRAATEGATARPQARELAPLELPDFSRWGPVQAEPMSAVRLATARQMSRAWTHIPHVTQHDQADVTDLEALRKRYAPRVQQAGGKLTMTAILLKVMAGALKTFPQFNASLDTAQERILYKQYIHLGVAVDTDRGLLVPVIRDVDSKNLTTLSIELQEMAEKARQRRIRPEDLQGGCMTLTNLGGIGGTAFTPIVNWPEVAILGASRGQIQPVWREGAFQPRTMLPLSLSYDHRLIDGAAAARFVRWIAEALESPFQLLLEG